MLCPRCQIDYNASHWGECPHCGKRRSDVRLMEPEGVMKTSTILISSDDGGIFRSIDEVPEPLRVTLAASTSGVNSATIVIADKGGRARIEAALRSLPQHPEMRPLVQTIPAAASPSRRSQMIWLGVLLAGGAGGLVWYIYTRAM